MASLVHVIAAPYPGRGHINPMILISRLIAARLPPSAALTVVLTEEWLTLLGGAASAPPGVRYRTIANVIPSEHGRAADFAGFINAVYTKMESPFERLLDELDTPPTAIIADVFMPWAVDVGKRRGIPVFSLSTISATYYSALLFYHRIPFPADEPAGASEFAENEEEDEVVSKYIDGHQSLRLSDFRFLRTRSKAVPLALEAVAKSTKAQCLIFTTTFELEPRIITSLRSSLPFPILPIGPNIPFATLRNSDLKELSNGEEADYLTFLNAQPQSSVLYVSLGSFLSVSSAQMDEIARGLQASNVKFLWVARDEASRLKETIGGGGIMVNWCDQLKVLCHPSVGGFLTHCGWNSTMEAAFAGVPMLTFPIIFDQWANSRVAVEEWGVGMQMRRSVGSEEVVGREKVADFVKRFMGLEGDESGEMRKKSMKLKEACRRAVDEGGSSGINLSDLVKLLSPEIKQSVAGIIP